MDPLLTPFKKRYLGYYDDGNSSSDKDDLSRRDFLGSRECDLIRGGGDLRSRGDSGSSRRDRIEYLGSTESLKGSLAGRNLTGSRDQLGSARDLEYISRTESLGSRDLDRPGSIGSSKSFNFNSEGSLKDPLGFSRDHSINSSLKDSYSLQKINSNDSKDGLNSLERINSRDARDSPKDGFLSRDFKDINFLTRESPKDLSSHPYSSHLLYSEKNTPLQKRNLSLSIKRDSIDRLDKSFTPLFDKYNDYYDFPFTITPSRFDIDSKFKGNMDMKFEGKFSSDYSERTNKILTETLGYSERTNKILSEGYSERTNKILSEGFSERTNKILSDTVIGKLSNYNEKINKLAEADNHDFNSNKFSSHPKTPSKLRDITNEYTTPNQKIPVSSPSTEIASSALKNSDLDTDVDDQPNLPTPKMKIEPIMGIFSQKKNKQKLEKKTKKNTSQTKFQIVFTDVHTLMNTKRKTNHSDQGTQKKKSKGAVESSDNRRKGKGNLSKNTKNDKADNDSSKGFLIGKLNESSNRKELNNFFEHEGLNIDDQAHNIGSTHTFGNSNSTRQEKAIKTLSSHGKFPELHKPSSNLKSTSFSEHNLSINTSKEISIMSNTVNSSHFSDHSSFDLSNLSSTPNSKFILDKIFEKPTPQNYNFHTNHNMPPPKDSHFFHQHYNQQQQQIHQHQRQHQQHQQHQQQLFNIQSHPIQGQHTQMHHHMQQQHPHQHPQQHQQQQQAYAMMMSTPQHQNIMNQISNGYHNEASPSSNDIHQLSYYRSPKYSLVQINGETVMMPYQEDEPVSSNM